MDRYVSSLLDDDEEDLLPEWRKYHTVYITDPLSSICYDTHNKDVKRIRDLAGITGKRAVTHFHRSDKASHAIENNVNTRDIESAVGWHLTSEGQKTYLKGALVTDFVMKAGKWKDSDSFFCSWESSGEDIPARLLSKVFCGLDNIITNISKASKAKAELLESEKNTCEVFVYLRKVFLEDAVYLIDLYPDWPVYRHHPVFKDPLWPVYKAAETDRVAARYSKFMADTPIGQIKRLLSSSSSPSNKKQKTTLFTDEQIQAAADAMQIDELAAMPFVLEPTDILAAYIQYNTIWKLQPRLNWKEWFGNDAKVNGTRYAKCVDIYKYIDSQQQPPESTITLLVSVAAALKVSQSCLVKNVFYFYKHPPNTGAVHQPLFTNDHIVATFQACGLSV